MATQIKEANHKISSFQKSLMNNMSRNDISTKYYHYTIKMLEKEIRFCHFFQELCVR